MMRENVLFIATLAGLALVAWALLTPGDQLAASFAGAFVFGFAGIAFVREVIG